VLVLGSLELCGAVARQRARGQPSTSEHDRVTKASAAQRAELAPYKKQHPQPALDTHSTKSSKTHHTKPKSPNHTLLFSKTKQKLTKRAKGYLKRYDKSHKRSRTINII